MAITFLWTEGALAFDAVVDATFNGQLYEATSPFGSPTIRRRRYTQTLSLKVTDMQGVFVPGEPRLFGVTRLRLDPDLGQAAAERNPDRSDRFVPGLEQAPLDVMVAYVEGRDFFDGVLDFRAGRQYVIDSLGFWSFDGALARIHTPAYFAVSGYGGFEQRGGFPLSTSRFEGDGVHRGDRAGLEEAEWPTFLEESRLAPAFGFSAETVGLEVVSAEVSYRKVINRDAVIIAPFLGEAEFVEIDRDRTSTERLGSALVLTAAGLGSVQASSVYDFYIGRPSEYRAALDWFTSSTLTLGGSYDYYLPTFDGDSIFNWFTHSGMGTALGHARWKASRRVSLSASGGLRRYRTEGDPEAFAEASAGGAAPSRRGASLLDGLGSLGSIYRFTQTEVSLSLSGQGGERGHLAGGRAETRRFFANGFYDALLSVSLYDWVDELRPSRDATSLTYVAGAGVRPFARTRAGLEWEHSINRLVGQRFRVLATLDVSVR